MESISISEIAFMAFGMFMMILFFVLVFFGLLFIRNKSDSKKKCPFCAEWIQSDAIFCRYCKKDLQ